ncbi:MAG TPA: 2-C-methyl-D-erythritol 2,4-cyclodiphosphate synthase, partial [Vicinamibacterales bacterium]|nr:2-C-methyl-D-erythritol 2,4-cyclodiphosphate synthase [Vicinamibacterales bacterium]
GEPKQFRPIHGVPMLLRALRPFTSHPAVSYVALAVPAAYASRPPEWLAKLAEGGRLLLVSGGEQRADSVRAALAALPPEATVVLVHDAARPFVTPDVISRAIDGAAEAGAAVAAVPVSETVKQVEQSAAHPVVVATLPREAIYLAQTPQAFRRQVLRDAVALGRSGVIATDEAMLAERAGHAVRVVEGAASNLKITTASDLADARRRLAGQRSCGRVGIGYDLHGLVEGRPLVLGGVTIPSAAGAMGHSDADAVCHAVTDAILGAAGLGDIGEHYPDTDPQWKDASSIELLREAVELVREAGWAVENVDVVVVLERPKLAPHRAAMKANLAEAFGISPDAVSVKAKTNEGVDAVGSGAAIAAHAVAMLTPSS